jgi:23S rRNA pseudouridine1911/1915/1917 synthase
MEQVYDQLFPFDEDKGKRLDVFLVNRLKSISRERAKTLISSGKISINGIIIQKPDYKLKGGEIIRIGALDETTVLSPPPEFIPLPIMYEDEHIIILNKPAGVSTHPTPTIIHNTVLNGLLYMNKELSDMGDPMRRGIVHRLDKQTCGLLIIAKDNESHIKLLQMFKQRTIHKTYIAVTYNAMTEQAGLIDNMICRHPVDRKRMTTKTTRGRRAITSFRVIKKFKDATVVALFPETGRTHQLRTQLSDRGYPIVNDTVYSKRKPAFRSLELQKMVLMLDGIALFAYAINFVHPIYDKQMSFSAPFPLWLKEVLKEDELY